MMRSVFRGRAPAGLARIGRRTLVTPTQGQAVKPRVVILGSGWGGNKLARGLDKKKCARLGQLLSARINPEPRQRSHSHNWCYRPEHDRAHTASSPCRPGTTFRSSRPPTTLCLLASSRRPQSALSSFVQSRRAAALPGCVFLGKPDAMLCVVPCKGLGVHPT